MVVGWGAWQGSPGGKAVGEGREGGRQCVQVVGWYGVVVVYGGVAGGGR